jgi:hypothetical protein
VTVLALIAVAVGARPGSSNADTQLYWSTPVTIVSGLPRANLPSLVYTRDGVAHAMWESNGELYYAYQQPSRPWSTPVPVAAGLAPSMIADAKGDLHALFSNQFNGNYEIYYIHRQGSTWSLPVNVSHTSGSSGRPVLAQSTDGKLQAVWMDSTPGYWVIYHGVWNGTFWSSAPVPNARGQVPSFASSPAGIMFLAWQDKVPTASNTDGLYDVFESELVDSGWSLPVNVSDSPDVDSLGVSIAATYDGVVHTTWAEQGQQIEYSYGRDVYWSEPQLVWNASSPPHAPHITADSGGYLSIAWDQFEAIWTVRALARPAEWPKPTMAAASPGYLKDVTIALLPSNGVAVSWVRTISPDDTAVLASWQTVALQPRTWMPLLSR